MSKSKIELRDIMASAVAKHTATLVKEGKTYTEIENILKQEGIVDHNGKPFHNAKLSSLVLKEYPELRQRTRKSKTKEIVSQQDRIEASLKKLQQLIGKK
jgi:hypothetical protein